MIAEPTPNWAGGSDFVEAPGLDGQRHPDAGSGEHLGGQPCDGPARLA
ncbi:hypothetical protein ACFZAR_19375 [Streptomyces sp. NPDC008222]